MLSANAYTLVSFDVPGSVYTSLRGINDLGEVTGSYAPSVSYATTAFLDDRGTITDLLEASSNAPPNFHSANSINDRGQIIVVQYSHYGPIASESFLYPGGTDLGHFYASGINNLFKVVGNQFVGFATYGTTYALQTHALTVLNPNGSPGGSETSLNGVNDRNQIVGTFDNQGFLYAHDRLTFIDYPGATSTSPQAINDLGTIVGSYANTPAGQPPQELHGFIDFHGRLTTLDFPGATSTEIFGINNLNQIVGTYVDANGGTHGFVGYLGHHAGNLATVLMHVSQT